MARLLAVSVTAMVATLVWSLSNSSSGIGESAISPAIPPLGFAIFLLVSISLAIRKIF